MGRHTADDGAGVDPIVAAALDRRPPSGDPGVPRHDERPGLSSAGGPDDAPEDGEGGLGWPGDPADGTGLGWPVDAAGTAAPADQPAATLVAERDPARRRGWRRLFGSSAA